MNIRLRAATILLLVGAAMGLSAFGAGEAIASHVSCGQTISVNTTLDSDLIGCTGDGLRIGADGITVDLNGHTISAAGSTGYGISNTGFDSVTIEYGLIRGTFNRGVSLSGATTNTVRGLDVSGPANSVVLFDSSDNAISGNSINNAYVGVGLYAGSNRNLVEGNSLSSATGSSGATVGVLLRPDLLKIRFPTDNAIVENESAGFDHGVNAIDAGATQVLGNEFHDGGPSYDIYFRRSAQATIEANQVRDTAADAIWVGEGPATIRGNLVVNTSKYGIYLKASTATVELNTVVESHAGLITLNNSDAIVGANNFSHNDTYGVLVDSTARITLLDGNIANHNDESGIEVNKPGTIVRENTASYNGELGIEAVPGTVDGGGNIARGNGDPRQCTNVMCM